MEPYRRLFAVGFVLILLVSLVPAPAAAADVTLTVTVETDQGETVANANLTATWDGGSTTGTTRANGQALLDVPEDATVEISVSHDDYMRNSPLVVDSASGQDITLTVTDTSSATVSVEDSNDEAVDDARVIVWQDGSVIVDKWTTDGTIETGPIEAGNYTVTVDKAKYESAEESLAIPADGPVEHVVDIEQGSVTLEFNVTDPYFDPPRALEGVSVTVEDYGSVTTQSDGGQQLSVPVNADLTVRFEAPNYQTVEQSVSTAEESMSLSVELDRTDALELTVHTREVVAGNPAFISVVDEYDDPVANATVFHNGEAVGTTDDNGQATVPIETIGTHEIQVEDETTTSDVATVRAVSSTTEAPPTTTTTTESTPTTEPTTAPTAEPPATTTTPTEAEPTTAVPETTTKTSGAPIPGFGPLVALGGVSLALVVALFHRYRRP